MNLEQLVARFFEILDGKETSNNDVEFNPVRLEVDEKDAKVYIGSCRVYKTAELESLLPKMKAFSKLNNA